MNKLDKLASFTAADTIPIKLFTNAETVKAFRPVHVQWFPTNRCNLNCSFCSCSGRDKRLQMKLSDAQRVIHDLADLGCRAVTITGGGEPLCHPELPQMIRCFDECGISVGLVSNGLLLDRLDALTLSKIMWCRLSHGDERELTLKYHRTLESAVSRGPNIDWAFSHVVSRQPNFEQMRSIVQFANEHGFTHVRIVADILDAANVDLEPVKRVLQDIDDLVLYQPRNTPTVGHHCMIGYVKPLIDPAFRMFLCCGVQYALGAMSRDLPLELSMGSALELDRIYGGDCDPYDVKCVRCFYENYNAILRSLHEEVKHEEFL